MPRIGRINTRLLVINVVVALPLFWYGYVIANQLIYHGIKPHDGYVEVDLKTLGNFTFNEKLDGLDQVPQRFRALDGKRVVLEGIMSSPDSASRTVDHFQFVYNLQICCFSGAPKVQERVFARCRDGKRVRDYENRPVQLTGILHVNIERDAEVGVTTAVYELDVESVEPI